MFQERIPELSEVFLGRLKRIVEDRHLPWDYAPLHRHLRQAKTEGRFGSVVAIEKS
jgi:hypothetical protein